MEYLGEDDIAILLGIIGFMLLISIVVQFFYLFTLSKVIESIRPQFRQVTPGQAWLGFIPLFHLIWPFIINPKVVASLREDLEDRGLEESGDYGKIIGSLYPGLRLGGYIPAIGGLFSLAYLVVFIIWWVKISGLRQKLGTYDTNKHNLLDN